MTCSECSHLLPEGVPTCPFCGAPVEDPFNAEAVGAADRGILPPAEVNECPCPRPSQSFRASTVRDEDTVGSTPGGKQRALSLGSKLANLGKAAWHETKRNYCLLSLKAQIEKLTRTDLRRAFHELGRKCYELKLCEDKFATHFQDISALEQRIEEKRKGVHAEKGAKTMEKLRAVAEDQAGKVAAEALTLKLGWLFVELGRAAAALMGDSSLPASELHRVREIETKISSLQTKYAKSSTDRSAGKTMSEDATERMPINRTAEHMARNGFVYRVIPNLPEHTKTMKPWYKKFWNWALIGLVAFACAVVFSEVVGPGVIEVMVWADDKGWVDSKKRSGEYDWYKRAHELNDERLKKTSH